MDSLTRVLMMGGSFKETDLPELVSSIEADVSFSNTTVTLSNLQADDVVFLTFSSSRATEDQFSSATSLAGWTTIVDGSTGTYEASIIDTGNPGIGLWYQVATGSSVSITINEIDESPSQAILMFAYRGLNTANPVVDPRLYLNDDRDITIPGRTNPGYNTRNLVLYYRDFEKDDPFSYPSNYTEILYNQAGQDDEGTVAAAYYADASSNGSLSSRTWSPNRGAEYSKIIDLYLVPEGQDGSLPIISGSTLVSAASGGTSVATYTANEAVTWSLSGANASLFSISSSGVVTYNSASTAGMYAITVEATDSSNLTNKLNVTITATSESTGGGISTVGVTSFQLTDNDETTGTLSNLQSGDVVFVIVFGDRIDANDANVSRDVGTLTANGGYTYENSQNYTAQQPGITVFRKVISTTSESQVFSATDGVGVVMLAFRGVDNTTPISATSSLATNLGTGVTIPSGLSTTEGAMIIAIAGLDDDGFSTITSTPTGYTKVSESSSSDAVLGVFAKAVSSGTEGSISVSFSSIDSIAAFAYVLNSD